MEGIGRTGAARGRALGAGRGGVPGRDRAVAGADAVDGAVRWRPGAPHLRPGPAVPADGYALRRSLAPHAAGLVLRAGGGGFVASVLAAAAVAVHALARGLARARRERTSVVEGTRVSVRMGLGGGRTTKKTN